MSFTDVLFYLLALVLVTAALRVVLSRSPVTAVLHLILVFFTASMLWMIQQAEFLSLLLVIVYVGAVMVMFLFVVMMLDMRSEGALKEGFRAHLPAGLAIAAVMALEMAVVLARSWFEAPRGPAFADDHNNTHALGELMYTQYAYAVEVGGVVLLVGMVAAIALTLRRRTDVKFNDPAKQVRVRAADRVRLVSMPSQSELPAARREGSAS